MNDLNVTTIVTHANCPDGIASAIILKDAIAAAREKTLEDVEGACEAVDRFLDGTEERRG